MSDHVFTVLAIFIKTILHLTFYHQVLRLLKVMVKVQIACSATFFVLLHFSFFSRLLSLQIFEFVSISLTISEFL